MTIFTRLSNKLIMKKYLYLLLGILLATTGTVFAVQISVPSASGPGFFLQSLGTGLYAPVKLVQGTGITIATTTSSLTISGNSGTVTAVSVASANGFTGSSSGGATPALTLTTSINSNVLKGNGTAISGAVNGTDYTLITALDCTGTGHLLKVTAAGVFTCSADTGGSGGTGNVATSSAEIAGQVPYWTTTSGTPAKLTSIATSTPSVTAPITYSGTLGNLIGGSSGAFGCTTATGSVAGCLSSTDWTTFNNKGSGTVTSVTGTYPIISSGGNTPIISTGFGTTTTIGVGNDLFLYTSHTGVILGVASSSLSLPNTALQNSTISGVALGGTLGALSATDATLTFSGSYTGATARTVGLNLGNANLWTALQSFGANASTTGLSAGYGYFGTTATTTIDKTGNITIPSGSGLTNTGRSDGCATWASAVLTSTGIACGSGSGGIGDPFTHPYALHSATTSTMIFTGGQVVTASSTFTGNATTSFNGGMNVLIGDTQYGFATGAQPLEISGTVNLPYQTIVSNKSTGGSAMSGYTLTNRNTTNLANPFSDVYYSGMYMAGSGWNTYPGLQPNDLVVVNSDAQVAIASLSSTTGAINFAVNPGFTTANWDARLLGIPSNGTSAFLVGTTTGLYPITIQSTTTPQLSLSNGAGKAQIAFRNEDGILAIASTTVAGTATSSPSALELCTNAGCNAGLTIGAGNSVAAVVSVTRDPGLTSTSLLSIATSTASGSNTPVFNIDQNGHMIFSGPKPTCDANCTLIVGNDNAFRIKTGTTITSTTITFANTWGTRAPICVSDEGDAGTVTASASSTPTTVVITIASALTAKDIDVHCFGTQ